MPTYKPWLTRREQAQYLRVTEELSSVGVDVDIPDEWRENAHALRILIAGPPASSIHQLASGLVAYVARVNLVAERGGMILQDFRITPAWDPDVFPCGSDGEAAYRLAPGCEYEWSEVLNQRLENYLCFPRRGDMREGWLLATGHKPVPKEYGAGSPAPLEVAFLDQFSQQHAASAFFVVERSTKATRPAARLRTGLYEGEDMSERVKGEYSKVLKRSNCRKTPVSENRECIENRDR